MSHFIDSHRSFEQRLLRRFPQETPFLSSDRVDAKNKLAEGGDMKTASLALAKFAIILVCCISPTLGNKRIVSQLRSGAPAFGFYTSELSSDTAVTLRGEIASVDRWTTLKEFRGNGVTYEVTDGQNSPGVKVGEM
jgi:hypothetical protein